MGILHEPRNTRFLIEHKRSGTIHVGHAIKVDHRGCRHEGPNSVVVYCLECGGSREPDEVRFGEVLDGAVITCQRCRRAMRDYLEEVTAIAHKWQALVEEFQRMMGAAG